MGLGVHIPGPTTHTVLLQDTGPWKSQGQRQRRGQTPHWKTQKRWVTVVAGQGSPVLSILCLLTKTTLRGRALLLPWKYVAGSYEEEQRKRLRSDAAGTAGPAASSATSAVWALVSSKSKEKMPRPPSHPLFTDFVVRMTTCKANLLTKSSKRI